MTKIEVNKTFKVTGMTCPNCELRIENKLKTLTGIVSAKAKYSDGSVCVVFDSSATQEAEIMEAIKSLDYELNSVVSSKKSSIVKLIGIVAVLFIVLLILSRTVELDIATLNPSMGYGILFVVGLVTSLHCITMCGGINLSLCMSYQAETKDKGSKFLPSILYNVGRVISYTLIGGIVGALGSIINISQGTKGIGAVISGAFMVLMGLNMMGSFPALGKYIPKMPKIFGNKLYEGIGKSSPLIIGLLNGLMPCGPLQSMQLYALGTGSFVSGALSMFLFSLGTVPAMFGFGAISSMLSKEFTAKMMKVSAVLVMILGIGMLSVGLMASR